MVRLSVNVNKIATIRNSRGGSPQMANFLISHFMGPDTVLSLGIYSRAENDTAYRWTMAEVPGPRRPDVPLFILVDGVTRSAAEDVTFVLHEHGRATTVGERTAGAGHMVTGVPVGSGLMAIMSVTRVFDPRTGREWERTGVPVDVRVPAAEALTTAHALALENAVPAFSIEIRLVHDARDAMQQRRHDAVGGSRYPAGIGRAPIDVVGVEIERHHAGGVVHHRRAVHVHGALGHAGRAAGEVQERHVFGARALDLESIRGVGKLVPERVVVDDQHVVGALHGGLYLRRRAPRVKPCNAV